MINGHFIDAQKGKLFVCQYGQPQPRKTLLLLPSLFEEMNLSRAVLTKQALFLASQGYCVYCIDYLGCGDSQREINQVTVEDWLENITCTATWLREQQQVEQLVLWGMRFGGLLVMQDLPAIQSILPIQQLLLWKPVVKGKQFMSQFIRTKQANSMIQGREKTNWRNHILAGNTTEVAGYPISAELLAGVDQLSLPAEIAVSAPLHWFELAAAKVTPAVSNQTDKWPAEQVTVSCHEGSAFWQIPEIFAQPALQQPLLAALQGRQS